MANEDQKVWNVANLIITTMAAIIAALVSIGFYSISTKIEIGDTAIYARLIEIKTDVKGLSETITRMQSDITRMDTLQKIRIERENREEGRKNAK